MHIKCICDVCFVCDYVLGCDSVCLCVYVCVLPSSLPRFRKWTNGIWEDGESGKEGEGGGAESSFLCGSSFVGPVVLQVALRLSGYPYTS